jgi:putative endonuclease
MATARSWRTKFGLAGESYAARLLESAGLVIIERRFRCKGGEIDLIARTGDTLVFVEVKARRGTRYGTAAETISWKKRRFLVRAAGQYLRSSGQGWRPTRFDVVALVSDSRGKLSAQWIPDAFRH